MKKLRLHTYIVLGLFVLGFILGTFLDLSLTEAIFSRDNTFGITMSAIGTLPGYMILAALGGGFVALALHRQYKTLYKVLLYVGALAGFGAAIFFSGREFFGPNGFTNEKIKWVGYLIALSIACGCGFLGYYLTKKSENKYLWLIYLIAAIAIFMALVPGVTLIKVIFHRPRYRTLSLYSDIDFYPWYKRCADYKDFMAQYNLTSEEFKSFPSGHAGASSVFMIGVSLLPLINKKFEKITLPLFYVGFAYALFVSFTRILVGAHFLSDVSMGGLLTSLFLLINNEVLIAINKKIPLAIE